MQVGEYTFEEFKEKAAAFHGYPAPGLLIGGYMVEEAKKHLPKDCLFEALVETPKCLPDAVQLLTLCSVGNQWLKIINLGRYAVSLYDKFTGEGVRIYLDDKKLESYPEIYDWLFKKKTKKDQDTEKLFAEIKKAGSNICSVETVQIKEEYLGHKKHNPIGLCVICGEAYPLNDGALCRYCQGERPYIMKEEKETAKNFTPKKVPLEEAIGKRALHDMTEIIPDTSKGAVFQAGQVLTATDMCRLQRMGKMHVYVMENTDENQEWLHEDEAIKSLAIGIAGKGLEYKLPPSEGKIQFISTQTGLLCYDEKRLERFNLLGDVMIATRQNYTVVEKGKAVAGARAIPLYLSRDVFNRALSVLEGEELLMIREFRKGKVGVLVTGTEVYQGLIEDKFAPIVRHKVEKLGSEVIIEKIIPDDVDAIKESVAEFLSQGVDLIITTAGLSVDPDDVTRKGLQEAGLRDELYGIPVLPGTMSMAGKIGQADILSVPACALFHKTTGFDILLPRVLAGLTITRRDVALLGAGGFCLNCKVCVFPKCSFCK